MKKGQSLVEFAFALAIILLLLSGATEFGIVFFQYVQLRDAAQEGALYGSMCQNESLIKERVYGSSNSPLDLHNTKIQIEGIGGKVGDGLKVSVIYDHKVFMPFIYLFTGQTIHLNAFVTDTILRVGC